MLHLPNFPSFDSRERTSIRHQEHYMLLLSMHFTTGQFSLRTMMFNLESPTTHLRATFNCMSLAPHSQTGSELVSLLSQCLISPPTISDAAPRLSRQGLQSQCVGSDSHEAPPAVCEAAAGRLCDPLPLFAEADCNPLPTALSCGGLAEGRGVCQV